MLRSRFAAALAILVAGALSSVVLADSAGPPRSHSALSENGRYEVSFEPTPGTWGEGTGVVREVAGDELYRLDWYAWGAAISDDGRTIVRFGPWASDSRNLSDLAIALYRDGRLTREYRVRDLLHHPNRISRTASHYTWRPSRQTVPNGFTAEGRFRLTVADGTRYLFDTMSGAPDRIEFDADVKTADDLMAEDSKLRLKRGISVLNDLAAETDIFKYFTITTRGAGWSVYGVDEPGPHWSGMLRPINHPSNDFDISLSLVLNADRPIERFGNGTARLAEVIEAARHCPYLIWLHTTDTDIKGLRFRVAGSSLVWSREKLEEQWIASGRDPGGLDDNRWVEGLIDYKQRERRARRFWLDVRTGQVIHGVR
ncbi:MAG: hypothetical protein AAGI46_07210 [Planctomycetota bacterium]